MLKQQPNRTVWMVLIIVLTSAALMLTACPPEPPGDEGDNSEENENGEDEVIEVTGVSLDKTNATIAIGATEQLTATVEPADAADQGVTWSSDNESVATVDADGLVTGAAEGTATVTVTTNDGGFTASCSVTVYYPPGYAETYTADGVSFDMAYVPGGLTFPTGTDDDGNATVDDAYWIADTEVTYELWYTVHAWATDAARGANQYTFSNDGREGHDGTDGAAPTGADQEPVTNISWRDSIVWCNALTEWYNAEKGTSYECVYTYTGSIIRDSTNATACDGADASATANGFRLLSSNEYECAARYRGTDTTNVVTGTIDGVDFDAMATKWTKGNSASGATTYYNDNTVGSGEPGKSANDAVAVYRYYWDGSSWVERPEYLGGTESVAGLTANTLGLYDMSGNVREWCFTESGSDRIRRGGSWYNSASILRVGYWGDDFPGSTYSYLGFRPCRTAD